MPTPLKHHVVPKHDQFTTLSDDFDIRISPLENIDDATFADIYILAPGSVESEKNIWAYWHTGWQTMAAWRQRIVIDWVRRHGPQWRVRVLDSVQGSPWHLSNFVADEYLPQCMRDGTSKNPYEAQHISDTVRLPLLFTHGGVWLDTGMMLFRDLDDICWRAISDSNDATEVATGAITEEFGTEIILQCIIAGKKGDPFLKRWHDVWLQLWQGRTSTAGMCHDPLVSKVPQIHVTKEWADSVGEAAANDDLLNDYSVHAYAGARVARNAEPGGFDGARYWEEHARLLDVLQLNLFSSDGFSQEREYELCKLPYKPNDDSVEQLDARKMVLNNARNPVKKLASGIFSKPTLAKLWDANPGTDSPAGTWAEYLRWARVHLVPKVYLDLRVPGKRAKVWHIALSEPVLDKEDVSMTPRDSAIGEEHIMLAKEAVDGKVEPSVPVAGS